MSETCAPAGLDAKDLSPGSRYRRLAGSRALSFLIVVVVPLAFWLLVLGGICRAIGLDIGLLAIALFGGVAGGLLVVIWAAMCASAGSSDLPPEQASFGRLQ